MIKKLALAAVCALGLSVPAHATDIVVEDVWAAMLEGHKDRGDIFMTITNKGSTPDRLYAIKTKVAKAVHLETVVHEEFEKDKSEQASSFLLTPGETLILAEEGAHVELTEMPKPLEVGDTFSMTLFFENAGRMSATVVVKEEEGEKKD